MKINLTFKTPDVVDYAAIENTEEGSKERAKFLKTCEKWVEYGEYLRVTIDTETGTCTVNPA